MNIVIIGATSGIGKALFVKYANADNNIGIVGRRANLLDILTQLLRFILVFLANQRFCIFDLLYCVLKNHVFCPLYK